MNKTKLRNMWDMIGLGKSRKGKVLSTFGDNTEFHYDLMIKSQYWPSAEMKNYQDEKIKKLISHAYENVKYYRNMMQGLKLTPVDIKSANDLNKLPLLTKDIIRKHFPDSITSVGYNKTVSISTTGGSTGDPLVFLADEEANAFAWASFFRFMDWIGYEWGDKYAIFFRPFNRKFKNNYHRMSNHIKHHLISGFHYFDASKLGEGEIEEQLARLSSLRPQILRGYPSALIDLARNYEKKGIRQNFKFITPTGETLYQVQRAKLRQVFQCDVFDQYGCTEVMGVSNECPEHSGLHISSEHIIIEVINDCGEVLPVGEMGQLAITDLDNYAMPFIRYLPGDIGRMLNLSCGCGRTLPLMDFVTGRSIDIIKGPNGKIAHGLYFVTLLKDIGWYEQFNILDYEIVQKRKDLIVCQFVCGINPDKYSIDKFINKCRANFGDMEIKVNIVPKIERKPSGKRRFIRSEVANDA